MKNVCLAFILLLAVVTLSGCGATMVAIKPDAISKVKSIALIEAGEPQTYVGNDFGNPGAAFGAIGGIAVAKSSNNAIKSINQVVKKEGFLAGQYLTESLQEELTALGYQVKLIKVLREKTFELLDSYESVKTEGADAVLDVAIKSIGYATEHPLLSPHWRPASVIEISLVSSLNNEKIYTEKFMYGYHNPFMSGTDLDAPKAYHHSNKESMFSDDKLLIEGMQDSVTAVVEAVSQRLQHK